MNELAIQDLSPAVKACLITLGKLFVGTLANEYRPANEGEYQRLVKLQNDIHAGGFEPTGFVKSDEASDRCHLITVYIATKKTALPATGGERKLNQVRCICFMKLISDKWLLRGLIVFDTHGTFGTRGQILWDSF